MDAARDGGALSEAMAHALRSPMRGHNQVRPRAATRPAARLNRRLFLEPWPQGVDPAARPNLAVLGFTICPTVLSHVYI